MTLRIAAFLAVDTTEPNLLRDMEPAQRADFVASNLTGHLVFISHKTADYDDAKRPARRLAANGLSVYFVEDDPSVAPGDRNALPDEIKNVVRACKGLLVYASDTLVAGDASWVCFEVGLAEMVDMEAARYTATSHDNDLLSPLRGLDPIEGDLGLLGEKGAGRFAQPPPQSTPMKADAARTPTSGRSL